MFSKVRHHLALIVLFLAWIIGQCQKTAIGVAVIPIGKEFGFDSVQLGWIISSFFASYAVLTFFGGVIADKFGPRKTVTTIIAAWSLVTAVTGFAWSLPSLIVTRFLCGAAEGGFPSASSVAIAELYPVEQRGRAKAFVVSAAQVGIAISTFAVAAFITTIGWRYAFWTYSALGLAVSLAFWFNFRPKGDGQATPRLAVTKQPIMKVLRSKLVLIMFVVQFATGTFFFGLNSWLPTYWVQVKGLSLMQMSSLTAVSAMVAFAVQNLFGWVIDKYLPRKEKYLVCVCLLIAAAGLCVMYWTNHRGLALICLSMVTTTIGVASSAIFVIAIKYFPKGGIGTATGLANFGQQIAAVVAPVAFGYFIKRFDGSYFAVFVFAVATVAIAFFAAMAIDTKSRPDSDGAVVEPA